MAKTKIVLIGAGSANFGPSTFADLCRAAPRLAGSTIALVDIDPLGLESLTALFRRMVEASGADLSITATTDRRQALTGAEFVVVAIAVDREQTWRLDFEVPLRHGVRHVLGENGGPGAFFHAARNIPPLLAICRDMEELCPDALLINYTNPEPRMILAATRYSKIRTIGLCHQVQHGLHLAATALGRSAADLDVKAAGINHFTWMLDLRDKQSGADLYPQLRRRLAAMPETFEPLSRELLDVFGLFVATGDRHAGEYVAHAHEHVGVSGYDFEKAARERSEMWADIGRVVSGALDPTRFLELDSGERAIPIICGILENTNQYELSVDVPNRGHITNLPEGLVVEVPALVSGRGVEAIAIGALPAGIATMCRQQMEIASLAVDAAVSGDKKLAFEALALDPLVPSPRVARAILNELLEAEARYLPQFQ